MDIWAASASVSNGGARRTETAAAAVRNLPNWDFRDNRVTLHSEPQEIRAGQLVPVVDRAKAHFGIHMDRITRNLPIGTMRHQKIGTLSGGPAGYKRVKTSNLQHGLPNLRLVTSTKTKGLCQEFLRLLWSSGTQDHTLLTIGRCFQFLVVSDSATVQPYSRREVNEFILESCGQAAGIACAALF
jgi:hypothetical protein